MNYTFIVNYESGTYIEQIVSAGNLHNAQEIWLERFEKENYENIKSKVFEAIKTLINSGNHIAVPVNEVIDVWCNDLGEIEGSYLSLTIVGSISR